MHFARWPEVLSLLTGLGGGCSRNPAPGACATWQHHVAATRLIGARRVAAEGYSQGREPLEDKVSYLPSPQPR